MTAGFDLFGTDGYRATSIEKLCAAAEISIRTFYEEFPGRDALLIAVHDRIQEKLLDAIFSASEAAGVEVQPRIEAGFTAWADLTFSDLRVARIVYVEILGVSAEVEESRQLWTRRYAAITLAGMTAAIPGGAVDRDYSMAAMAYVGASNEMMYEWALHGMRAPVEEIVAELSRIYVAVLETP